MRPCEGKEGPGEARRDQERPGKGASGDSNVLLLTVTLEARLIGRGLLNYRG